MRLLFCILFLSLAAAVLCEQIIDYFIYSHQNHGDVHVRYGVYTPHKDASRSAILYFFHGLSDRFDNHEPLFETWNNAGIEVRAFDLPGHGINAGEANDINLYRFRDVAKIFCHFSNMFSHEKDIPIILSGWSLGALLLSRFLQNDFILLLQQEMTEVTYLNWNINAVLLITPATYTHPVKGGLHGLLIKTKYFTSNPNAPVKSDPVPDSILKLNKFGPRIELNAVQARIAPFYHQHLHAMMIVGGDKEDVYSNSVRVKEWVRIWNTNASEKFLWIGLQCQHAYHMVDNEPNGINLQVRKVTTEFFLDSLKHTSLSKSAVADDDPCQFFTISTTPQVLSVVEDL